MKHLLRILALITLIGMAGFPCNDLQDRFLPSASGQDVCVEEVVDVEEETAILFQHRIPRSTPAVSASAPCEGRAVRCVLRTCHPIRFCFERQWLTCCRLRL